MSNYQIEKKLNDLGIMIRNANHFEEKLNEYGEKLRWVIDNSCGQRLQLVAYKTKKEALEKARSLYIGYPPER